MGAWRMVGMIAAAAALLSATSAAGGTVLEPIARLYLEGGYDSNPLYNGTVSARSGRISPDLGLRLHAPLWDLRGTYGGDLIYLDWGGTSDRMWNQRAALSLVARPTRRTALQSAVQFSQAVDPTALARVGVFRGGRHRAIVVDGGGYLDWRAERDVGLGATLRERAVVFDDGTGGAMHTPGVEFLWRRERRLSIGAAYGFGVFQSFAASPAEDSIAYSHALRARLRWRPVRHVSLNAYAGPALWLPAGGSSIVPEAFAELLIATRGLDLRFNVGHGLGIGATAHPGLVDAVEFGAERRFGRSWFIRGDGGIWRSGTVPSGRDAVTGYAIGGEAGVRFENEVRLSVTAAQYGRVNEPSSDVDRTTVGLRLGWEVPNRR